MIGLFFIMIMISLILITSAYFFYPMIVKARTKKYLEQTRIYDKYIKR